MTTTIADAQDKYRLYLESVQSPQESADEIDRVYEQTVAREPRLLIEDFSGAGALSAAWLAKNVTRRAIAVDIDPVPQAWGQVHLSPVELERLRYETVSVLDHRPTEKADIIAAMNFSWMLFTTRDSLHGYFDACRRRLARGGALVMDMMAGTDAPIIGTEGRVVKPSKKRDKYKYFWSCRSYNALTALGTWTISWKFRDDSKLKDSFKYEWRLWTLPEVTEILTNLGFKVTVWVDIAEDEDETDLQPVTTYHGEGVFLPYIVATI